MAVTDKADLSPFSIAILRGHQHVAKAILEIVQAQYKPKESETSEKFTMDENDLEIYREIIDERFTIDDIGEAATQVECGITPLQVLQWSCPVYQFMDQKAVPGSKQLLDEAAAIAKYRPNDLVQYAILNDDVELLSLLLELGQEISARNTSTETTSIYTIPGDSFDLALRHGRVRCLVEIVRKTGGGLPIDDLVRRSGVAVQEKPKYYQGLSIHGKKRPDWATAGRGRLQSSQMTTPPLLKAALLGNLESTEWFLGTAPRRYYNDFTEAHKHDKGLKRLEASKLGIEGSVMNWLGLRSMSVPFISFRMESNNALDHLVLHCAVLSQPTEESARLVQYLVDEYPVYLEAKSAEGFTPLQLALGLHRVRFARVLIEAGANQAVRDDRGRNLVHIILCGIGLRSNLHTSPAATKTLLGLLDRRLIPSMLSERCSEYPGSLTPLSYWLSKVVFHRTMFYGNDFGYYCNDLVRSLETDRSVEVARILLDVADGTGQKHLEALNGAGNTPIHDTIKKQLPRMFEMMIDRRPDLLHREDATGCTPFELAANLWVNDVASGPPWLRAGSSRSRRGVVQSLVDRSPEYFAQETEATRQDHRQTMYEICRERGQNGHKRKLVSLHEANEVAKRLAAEQGKRRANTTDEVEDGEEDDEKKDEVSTCGGLRLKQMYTYDG